MNLGIISEQRHEKRENAAINDCSRHFRICPRALYPVPRTPLKIFLLNRYM